MHEQGHRWARVRHPRRVAAGIAATAILALAVALTDVAASAEDVVPGPPTLTGAVTVAYGSTFFVHGVGEPGATVTLHDLATPIATVAADAAGFYSARTRLAVGGHLLTARQTVAGVTSDASAGLSMGVSPPVRVQRTTAGSARPGSTRAPVRRGRSREAG